MEHLNIGEAAAAAGVTPKMIRHYESLGLLPGVQRTEAGYRLYSPREVGMLRFIRQSRALGFSMVQIDSLLALWRDEQRASREVRELARAQLAELAARRRELDEMCAMLQSLVERCRGDDDPHCAILEQLAGPPAAAPAASPTPRRRALKDVRPGSKAAPRGHCHPAPAEPPAGHAALAAWSRGLGRA